MKVVGVFRELEQRSAASLPSIHEAAGLMPNEVAQKILAYLKLFEPVFD